ncbi:hypothetical protein KR054_007707 [Drosophila jambulina]|nr:hypothetical protein KR054_007707 [Drosophila jambulina]
MTYLLLRIALVAGAVYGTQELGIWDSVDQSVLLYESAKREIQPMAEDLMEHFCSWRCDKGCEAKEVVAKPWRETMVDAWNDTVKKTFHLLGVEVPSYYHRFTEDLGHSIDDAVHKGKHR